MSSNNRIMFVTLGTGVRPLSDESPSRSLALAIQKSILNIKPEKIIFFVSDKSRSTYEEILLCFDKDPQYSEKNLICSCLSGIDDFSSVYKQMQKEYLHEIHANPNATIYVDYTSGTKTMSMALGILALLYNLPLLVITGERSNGIVQSGTEKFSSQNLYLAYDYLKVKQAVALFNSCKFVQAKEVFKTIITKEPSGELMPFLMGICDLFDSWDKFNREPLAGHLKSDPRPYKDVLNILPPLKEYFNMPLRSNKIKALDNDSFKIIVELIHNADRRISEGKYDDAVARLYRVSELIAQTILKCVYGLNTSDVDVDKLGSHLKDHKDYESILEEYKNKRLCSNDKKTIKIGLFEDFRLLSLLNDEPESYLEINKRFKNLILKRNTSILAHGLVPIDKSDASDLFSEVLKLVGDKWSELEISPSFDDVYKKSQFPKLDVAEVSRILFGDP